MENRAQAEQQEGEAFIINSERIFKGTLWPTFVQCGHNPKLFRSPLDPNVFATKDYATAVAVAVESAEEQIAEAKKGIAHLEAHIAGLRTEVTA